MTLTAPTGQHTVPTHLVEAMGIEFAFRRFGHRAGIPLVMLQHFRGNLDNWDPALTDALATEREVTWSIIQASAPRPARRPARSPGWPAR